MGFHSKKKELNLYVDQQKLKLPLLFVVVVVPIHLRNRRPTYITETFCRTNKNNDPIYSKSLQDSLKK